MNLINLWIIGSCLWSSVGWCARELCKKRHEVREEKKKLNINGVKSSHSISTGSGKSSRLFVLSVAYFTRGTLSDQDVAWSSEDR